MEILVERVLQDEGSVVVFEGHDVNDVRTTVRFAADHRPAQSIIEDLDLGPIVDIELWQLV